MILGISASGRPGGETAKMVQAILDASGHEYEFISLAGKKISGCIGCLKCASTGACAVQDDWPSIAEKCKNADAIVFGAPTYSFNINALGHAFLERFYAFRHGRFLLAGKLAVIVTPEPTGGDAQTYIEKMMGLNKMVVLEKVAGESGIAPCYDCGHGVGCFSGSVMKSNNVHCISEDTQAMVSNLRAENSEVTKRAIQSAAWLLNRVLNNR